MFILKYHIRIGSHFINLKQKTDTTIDNNNTKGNQNRKKMYQQSSRQHHHQCLHHHQPHDIGLGGISSSTIVKFSQQDTLTNALQQQTPDKPFGQSTTQSTPSNIVQQKNIDLTLKTNRNDISRDSIFR